MRLGIDIGGTSVKFGVLDDNYDIIYRKSLTTDIKLTDREFSDIIISIIKEIKLNYEIESIGIGSAGDVNHKTGVIERAKNLPFKNTPLKDLVFNEMNIPVYVENDANCAALAEVYKGEGKSYNDVLVVTLGTGIGGGIIINKMIYRGCNGKAGEIGHMGIDFSGEKCKCGQVGCWELYASATALISQTKEAALNNPDSLLAEISKVGIDGKTVFDAVLKGCDTAISVLNKYLDYLSYGLTNLIRCFQPDLIIISGGISKAGDLLLTPLREKIRFDTPIKISSLQNDAGIIGAALLQTQY